METVPLAISDATKPSVVGSPKGVARAYRGDIDGLRAVSVLLVVAFHAGLPFVSGGFVGVDVFFVISGFLITGLLLDQLETGRLSLAGFYARRVRRLLPLSALVLVSTAIASALLIAPLDRPRVAGDIRSAALYFSNWHFASQATDYMAANVNTSPVLHYWSLSVEEQFYVAWPLLILGAAALSRLGRGRLPSPRVMIGIVLGGLGIGSWVISVALTSSDGSLAYFATQSRAWELAAGAGLAMALPALQRLPRAPAAIAGWVGLVLIVGSALVFSRDTPFPGTAASYPVLGAVLVLGAGARIQGNGVARPLSGPRVQYVGRISYAWYLWHWPFLVFLQARFGSTGVAGAFGTATAVAASFVVAALTHRVLEDPVRRSRWLSARLGWTLVAGLALTAVSVAAAFGLADAGDTDLAVNKPVIAIKNAAPVILRMTPEQARELVPGIRDCHATARMVKAPADCTFGDPAGKVTIALVGDSHAEQWFPALLSLAVEKHWRLLSYTKDACAFMDVPIWHIALARPYLECTAWRANVAARLKAAGHIDAVVIARTAAYRGLTIGSNGQRLSYFSTAAVDAMWAAGAAKTFAGLEKITSHIVVLKDNPFAPTDIPACLSSAGTDVAQCAFPRSDGLYGASLDAGLVAAEQSVALPNVSWLDMTDQFCDPTMCPAVDSRGLIIYRNHDHLTVAEILALRDIFATKLADIMAN